MAPSTDQVSRLAVLDSQPSAGVVEDAPMPSRGWGEVRGPYLPKEPA